VLLVPVYLIGSQVPFPSSQFGGFNNQVESFFGFTRRLLGRFPFGNIFGCAQQ
jgi:hypothetical protein